MLQGPVSADSSDRIAQTDANTKICNNKNTANVGVIFKWNTVHQGLTSWN